MKLDKPSDNYEMSYVNVINVICDRDEFNPPNGTLAYASLYAYYNKCVL